MFKPKVVLSICHSLPLTALLALSLPTTPKTVPPLWQKVMLTEYHALLHIQTWTPVPPSKHKFVNIMGCKCVFKVKTNSNGTLDKCKACLVAKGFH